MICVRHVVENGGSGMQAEATAIARDDGATRDRHVDRHTEGRLGDLPRHHVGVPPAALGRQRAARPAGVSHHILWLGWTLSYGDEPLSSRSKPPTPFVTERVLE